MTLQASGAISFSDINTELGLSSTSQISMNDAAVRTLFSQASGAISMTAGYGKSNTSTPGAPTGVSASATGSTSASVSFSAPACNGHLTIDYYQAISSPGCFTATGTSPISVSGLSGSTSYTFRVRAHNSKGYGCYSSSSGSITTSLAPGSQVYGSAGAYTFVVPAGVTSISLVAVGGGGGGRYGFRYYSCGANGGGGGGLKWRNNLPVSPGQSITVNVGAGGAGATSPSCCLGGTGGNSCVNFGGYCTFATGGNGYGSGGAYSNYNDSNYGGGGAGGCAIIFNGPYPVATGGGGGGAAGYTGKGGNGARGRTNSFCCRPGVDGCGGGGSGGASGRAYQSGKTGGGVGLYGQGNNGQGVAGGAGNGSTCHGGPYPGGGGGGGGCRCYGSPYPTSGNGGAVRIVWPGSTRTFPSTCVGSP